MILTTREATEALLAAAEAKVLKAAAADDLVPTGAAAQMAAQVVGPTATIAQIRALRASNKQLFDADPAGAVVRFGGAVEGLLGLLGLA